MKNPILALVEANDTKFRAEAEEKRIAAAKAKKAEAKDAKGKPKKGESKGSSEDLATREISEFAIGDTVDIHLRILEGTKERLQVFNGVVIARRGAGANEMFTVRRIVQGEGVERIFPLNSPKIARIEVKRTGEVRRAKLYYMRDRVGKATRLRERKEKVTATAPSANGSANGVAGKAGAKAKAETAAE